MIPTDPQLLHAHCQSNGMVVRIWQWIVMRLQSVGMMAPFSRYHNVSPDLVMKAVRRTDSEVNSDTDS
jgi:hypothetical protein